MRKFMFPHLLSVLIILRLKNQALYQGFIKGDRRGSEVMDYIDKLVFDEELDSDLNDYLDLIEAGLYLTQAQSQAFVTQLGLIWKKEPLTHPEYLEDLSERTKKSGEEKLKKLLQIIERSYQDNSYQNLVTRSTIGYLSGLIELLEIPQQRQQR
ncbi:MAG: hypothetical protein J4F29_20580 [Candidatus Latescibacteria bacterium]|nr:hypothetical protein [Candidatus Latescibacterota bacterium]